LPLKILKYVKIDNDEIILKGKNMATIQWFPGHMSKARRQVQESIKFVDFVTVLVDARLPLSSQNPMLTKIVGEKPKLLVLNKADLADPVRLKEWQTYFEGQGIPTLALNSKEQSAVKKVTDAAKKLMAGKLARQKERGIRIETLRTMIIGIPNAGKSTLMNRLAGKKIAVVGNKPGVTKGQQWLKSNKDLEILDTPGILWPKFEDEMVALKLALTGAIKDNLLPMDEVTIFGLNYFKEHYPEELVGRYKQLDLSQEAPEIIMDMTQKLGFRDDYDRFYSLFVKDVRDGKLGRYCLDIVGELDGND
jgi:ribosome biogenesis GTP-binding protein ylqF